MIVQLNRKRGQTTLEFALLIIVVIAALVSISAYLKRGVQGKVKDSADQIGDQFSPGNTNVVMAEKVSYKQTQQQLAQGETTTTTTNQIINSVTKKAILKDQETW